MPATVAKMNCEAAPRAVGSRVQRAHTDAMTVMPAHTDIAETGYTISAGGIVPAD